MQAYVSVGAYFLSSLVVGLGSGYGVLILFRYVCWDINILQVWRENIFSLSHGRVQND